MLKWLFRRYRTKFEDFFVEEYFGMVPTEISEPSILFLAQNRVQLEKFFSLQAYEMMRRARNDEKNYERYIGVLIHIRSLIAALKKQRVVREDVDIPQKQENPVEKIKDFVQGFKEKKK
jgi:hypothetical protein